MVAWRSKRAEARNAVAVRAARETRARTLIRAKLGEEAEAGERWRAFILVAGHVNAKLVGASIFLDVGGINPIGVGNFLG
jgi:hypothetical protein